MMQKVKNVDEYIEVNPDRKKELEYLRSLVVETELEECIKWMFPVYTLGKKNVIGLGAFKKYVGIWFYQGVFLTDPLNVIVNAQEGVTKAMRQWRFDNLSEIKKNKNGIKAYLAEAIQNQKDGKEVAINRSKKKSVSIPAELQTALKKNKQVLKMFDKLSDYKKREFCEYIGTAKRAATKHNRIDKILPMIKEGVGLNDRYKK